MFTRLSTQYWFIKGIYRASYPDDLAVLALEYISLQKALSKSMFPISECTGHPFEEIYERYATSADDFPIYVGSALKGSNAFQ